MRPVSLPKKSPGQGIKLGYVAADARLVYDRHAAANKRAAPIAPLRHPCRVAARPPSAVFCRLLRARGPVGCRQWLRVGWRRSLRLMRPEHLNLSFAVERARVPLFIPPISDAGDGGGVLQKTPLGFAIGDEISDDGGGHAEAILERAPAWRLAGGLPVSVAGLVTFDVQAHRAALDPDLAPESLVALDLQPRPTAVRGDLEHIGHRIRIS